jgi:capsular exopolysaccharide synthesis family protein
MSRLKDALEKAAAIRGRGDDTGVTVPATTTAAEMAPASWRFDDAESDTEDDVADDDRGVSSVAAFAPVQEIPLQEIPRQEIPRAEKRTQSPALVSPPATDLWAEYRFGRGFREKIVVGPEANLTLVEQYRRLGAALHHHQLQGGARTVMITSAVPAEGKTLTAANLALTLSESYMRQVLLIDADLRRPSIHDLFQLPGSPGLTESLLRAQHGSLPIHRVSPNLSVLTAGRPSSDPMSGLVSDTMNHILNEGAQQFDWVIVDTPPVGLLPDANLLAAMIDTALLVVGANKTPYPLIARAVQAIGEQRILGVVLNRIEQGELISPYNYYGDWYQGYGESKKKKKKWRFGLFGKRPGEKAEAV